MLWGVSGPIFLLDYLGAVAVAVVIALAVRELTGRRTRGATPDRVELAYLTHHHDPRLGERVRAGVPDH
ncbi:hypothetical protein ABZS65_31150, partial [Micromonospora sp. NPDC005313]